MESWGHFKVVEIFDRTYRIVYVELFSLELLDSVTTLLRNLAPFIQKGGFFKWLARDARL